MTLKGRKRRSNLLADLHNYDRTVWPRMTEEIPSEVQAGLRSNRSTIDQIFTLRQLAEKYQEFGKELYVCMLHRFSQVCGERVYGEL